MAHSDLPTPPSMAALPFRPPHFSDDSAWLPLWIQSNQVATPLIESNEDQSHRFLENRDSCKEDSNPVKGFNILSGTENSNPYRFHLSGEESQVVFTPSCEKMLHFNLHLSTDGFSSIITPSPLEFSEYEKSTYENTKQVEPGKAPNGSEEARKLNEYRNVSIVDNFPPSNIKTKSNTSNFEEDIPNILKSNDTEGDDISDAVELSVAASETLAIYDIVQSESISEALSASAVLEIALRVKHARLEGSRDSLCCTNEDDNATDILSELCDSDMEEAYEDVGFSLNCLNTMLKDSSVSRVMDTPLEFRPEQEREVQSELNIDMETFVDCNFAEQPLENSLGSSKLMNLLSENIDSRKLENLCRNKGLDVTVGTCQSQRRSSDDLQIMQASAIQGDFKTGANVDGLSQQIEEKSFSQGSMSAKANEMGIDCLEMGQTNDNSSSRFQSRWFGGWTGQDEFPWGGTEPKAIKTVPKPFNGETSYLSESADIAPDQSSFVHNNPHNSKPSYSTVPFDDSYGTANAAAITQQEVVKDSILSSTDPLCSVVPCSLSAHIDSSSPTTNNAHTFRVPTLDKDKTPALDNVLVDAQVDSIGRNPIFRRTLTSLRPYSAGLPENPTSSFNNFNYGRECDSRLLSGNHERTVPNENGLVSPTLVISTSHSTAMRSNEENSEAKVHVKNVDTSNGKLDRIVPALSYKFSSYIARNDEENREIIGQRNAFDVSFQGGINRNVENGRELDVQLQEPSPPLVLCRTRRRFKALKSPFIHSSPVNQVNDRAPESDTSLHKNRENPQNQQETFSISDEPVTKRVRFSEIAINPKKSLNRLPHIRGIRSSCRAKKKPNHFDEFQVPASQEVKAQLTKCPVKSRKKRVFQGLEFLVTGFSKKKEKELEGVLRKHGGLVLSDIPTPPADPRRKRCWGSFSQRLPVILCTKKLQTTKFLYGCAVNAFLLKVGWAYDSIKAGSVLPPDKYVILSNRPNQKPDHIGKSIQKNDDYIFDKVGIMLHGRHSFCSKFIKFIKHGGGRVYKSLHWLVQSLESNKISVGAIVAEDDNNHATRHLRKCASEQKIPVLPGSWIINSLHEGKLLPFKDSDQISHLLKTRVPKVSVAQNWSQEI